MINNSRRRGGLCPHDVIIKGMCGVCGVRLEVPNSSEQISMIHSVPELRVSREYARTIGQADQERLIEDRKLVLLVDLDQTILHTTHEEVHNLKDVHTFTLEHGHPTYHTKLRPFLTEFLDDMSKLYEMHIITFGCRRYAHKIASLIDPNQKYFGNRILSRDESVDQFSKRGNLNNLFPCGDAMVCIIDDRTDVWNDAGNLIQVKPYSYFRTSISDGAQKMMIVEDEESLDRDVDKLEALLGLDSDDDGSEGNDCNEGEDNQSDSKEVKDEESIAGKPADRPDTTKQVPSQISDNDQEKHDQSSSSTNPLETCDQGSKRSIEDVEDETIDTSQHGAKKVRFEDASDSSMKDCDENDVQSHERSDEVEEDLDEFLLHLPKILRRIHDKWYMELDEQRRFLEEGENYKMPDIKDIIKRYLRKRY